MAPAAVPGLGPDEFGVSPDIGPVPAIYVPRPPEQISGRGLVRRVLAEAGRLARGWAAGRRPHVPTGGTMTDIPTGLRYGQDHLWARPDPQASLVRVGVTDFAQQSLGDVVDVTLPRLGDTVAAGEPCGDIESTKSVNDLIAPVTGTVRARNDDLADSPELVNTDPYGQGWMFEVEADPGTLGQQLAALMDAGAYREQVGG